MKKLFDRVNQYFHPAIEGIDVNKYNLLICINWLTSIFALFYILVSQVISFQPGVYIMVFNFTMFLFNLFLIKNKISYRSAVNIYLSNCLFVAILGCTWFSGGLYSPVIPWFVLVPITSLLLLGTTRDTIFWLVVTSISVFSYFIISQLEIIDLSQNFNPWWSHFFFYACIGGLVLILYLVTQVFENIKNTALLEVSKKNIELQQAITQLKNAHEQLVQQEKLASLGQLTAGIAHEIKNPLNFVNNFSQLSIELLNDLRVETDEKIKNELFDDLIGNLTKIIRHGSRADFIVKSMLQHSRRESVEFQMTDINKICHEYMNLTYHGIRASERDFHCKLTKILDERLPMVYCMPQDISRVILNLLNNAMYAVKDVAEPIVSIRTYFDKSYVYIEIKDNGTGMTEETQRKLFEPFYTTKPTGHGTGLGLSISHDIMKAHGGKLELSSEQGKGSTFFVALPIKK